MLLFRGIFGCVAMTLAGDCCKLLLADRFGGRFMIDDVIQLRDQREIGDLS